MSQSYISKALRDRVAAQARHRCGYCLTPASLIGRSLEIEHIFPESLGGTSDESNLWIACPLCNYHKGSRISAVDPSTGERVRLFNPREQAWSEHFAWSDSGDRIVGVTGIGRATVGALNLNRPSLVSTRRAWVSVGWHPPKD